MGGEVLMYVGCGRASLVTDLDHAVALQCSAAVAHAPLGGLILPCSERLDRYVHALSCQPIQ